MDKLEDLVKRAEERNPYNVQPLYYMGCHSGSRLIKKVMKSLRKDMKYYLECNEENGVVTIPRFMLEKWIGITNDYK